MAIKACGECSAGISDKARICPHCGIKNPHQGTAQRKVDGCGTAMLKWGSLLIIIGAVLVVIAC